MSSQSHWVSEAQEPLPCSDLIGSQGATLVVVRQTGRHKTGPYGEIGSDRGGSSCTVSLVVQNG